MRITQNSNFYTFTLQFNLGKTRETISPKTQRHEVHKGMLLKHKRIVICKPPMLATIPLIPLYPMTSLNHLITRTLHTLGGVCTCTSRSVGVPTCPAQTPMSGTSL